MQTIKKKKRHATWNRWNLFSGHPQEVSNVELPDIKKHAVPLQLLDQLLFSMMAAAAQTGCHIMNVLLFLQACVWPQSVLPRRLNDIDAQYDFIGSGEETADAGLPARSLGILAVVG